MCASCPRAWLMMLVDGSSIFQSSTQTTERARNEQRGKPKNRSKNLHTPPTATLRARVRVRPPRERAWFVPSPCRLLPSSSPRPFVSGLLLLSVSPPSSSQRLLVLCTGQASRSFFASPSLFHHRRSPPRRGLSRWAALFCFPSSCASLCLVLVLGFHFVFNLFVLASHSLLCCC